jgi:hypothetical protein
MVKIQSGKGFVGNDDSGLTGKHAGKVGTERFTAGEVVDGAILKAEHVGGGQGAVDGCGIFRSGPHPRIQVGESSEAGQSVNGEGPLTVGLLGKIGQATGTLTGWQRWWNLAVKTHFSCERSQDTR